MTVLQLRAALKLTLLKPTEVALVDGNHGTQIVDGRILILSPDDVQRRDLPTKLMRRRMTPSKCGDNLTVNHSHINIFSSRRTSPIV